MAKRDRVPSRKSLGGGGRRRNKNPKLSPFQREQKRDRLANQPPIEPANKRDYPGKQRAVYEYLQARDEREAAKKEKRKREEAERQELADATSTASAATASTAVEEGKARKRARKEADCPSPVAPSPAVEELTSKKKKKQKADAPMETAKATKKDAGLFGGVESLNEKLRAGAAPIGDRLDVGILKKKEKKHQKRLEQRKERISARMESIEREALEVLNRKRVKRGADQRSKVTKRDEAYERELVKMQLEKAKEDAQSRKKSSSASAAPVVAADYLASPEEAKKRISFASEADQGPSTAHAVARPGRQQTHKSFHQMIDIVRFGERVDAPPVFNALPDKQSAISKLAAKLHEEEMRMGAKRKAPTDRRAMLGGSSSGVPDPNSFFERKRLASLGLAPRVSGTVVTESVSSSQPTTTPQQNEFERLRQKVQEAYQRSKAIRYGGQRGGLGAGGPKGSTVAAPVNLKHEFPQI